MKSKFNLYITLLVGALFMLSSCGSGKKEATANEEQGHAEHASGSTAAAEPTAPQFTVDAAFQQQLAGIFNAYVSLKDAFVASDASKVKTEAGNTIQALAKADMKLLTGAAHNDWMNYLANLESSLKQIQSSDDIEAQRESFSTLSDNLYKSIKAFGLGGATAYYEFCPMAFNNQGGYWLSNENKILNPYFGDKMLTCGEVKETMK